MIIMTIKKVMPQFGASLSYNHNWQLQRHKLQSRVVNYNCNHVYSTCHKLCRQLQASFTMVIMFIVQATGCRAHYSKVHSLI
jgi:hypothetical protein